MMTSLTAEVLLNSFFVIGIDDLTDGTKAFINFPKDLLDSNLPLLLPKALLWKYSNATPLPRLW